MYLLNVSCARTKLNPERYPLSNTVCKNCSQRFEGAFCNNCGQDARVRRIDSTYIVDEVTNNLFQLNRGLFFTMKRLALKPGDSIKEFLEGKRKQYVKPLSYVLVTSALYVLTTFFLGLNTFFQDFTEGFTSGVTDEGDAVAAAILNILTWLTNNHTYTVLLTLPLFSAASYLAFKRSRYNYFEHLILNMYITGQQMLIYLLSSFTVVEDSITEAIPSLLGIAFSFWAFYQFFRNHKPFVRILLTILTYVLFFIQIIALMSLGVVLVKVI